MRKELKLTMTADLKYKDKTKGKGYYCEDSEGKGFFIRVHGDEVVIGDERGILL